MRTIACLLCLFMLCAGFAEGAEYVNRLDMPNGSFFAYLEGESMYVEPVSDFTDAFYLPLLVYVDETGARTSLGYREVNQALECGIVACGTQDGLKWEYRVISAAGEELGEPFYSGAAFEHGYTAVMGEGEQMGIIDEAGQFIIAPEYANIGRASSFEFAGFSDAPYFCADMEGGVAVIDCKTLETIAAFDNDDRYLHPTYLNPAVFMIESWSERKVVSMQTGEILWAMPIDEGEHDFSGEALNERIEINGIYSGFIEGLPQRLVVSREDGETSASYLTDNAGNIVSGEYQYLRALSWANGEGVFLAERYDDMADERLVGLIDKDGKALTEIIYASVEALSASQYALKRVDGAVETIDIGNMRSEK